MLDTRACKDLTCYSKAPFVKFYSVIHKMCYNLHGSAFGLDYAATGRKGQREKVSQDHQIKLQAIRGPV